MSDKAPMKFRTCKSCGHDNPDDASKCNGCAKSLTGAFTDNFHSRWGCPDCGRVNMSANSKCICGYKVPGCFLTTACVDFAGLPDDCETLTLMRKLRDEYVAALPEGESLIAEYYENAPKIVDAIDRLTAEARNAIYSNMLFSLSEISHNVKSGDFIKAKDCYMKMYTQTRDVVLK